MGLPENVFYVNTVSASYLPVDVAVSFGFLTPVQQEGGQPPVLCLHMSPAMAKIVAKVMADVVAKYEAQFGPLPDFAVGGQPAGELQ